MPHSGHCSARARAAAQPGEFLPFGQCISDTRLTLRLSGWVEFAGGAWCRRSSLDRFGLPPVARRR